MLQYSSIVFTWPYSMRFILDKKSPVLCRIAGSTFCPSPVKELLDFSAKTGPFWDTPHKKNKIQWLVGCLPLETAMEMAIFMGQIRSSFPKFPTPKPPKNLQKTSCLDHRSDPPKSGESLRVCFVRFGSWIVCPVARMREWWARCCADLLDSAAFALAPTDLTWFDVI